VRVGFNPLQGRKPKATDLAIFAISLAVIVALVIWAIS
jgi:hypothetical protein